MVRCRECKWWQEDDDIGHCDNPDGLDNYAKPDDFYSYGERKEGAAMAEYIEKEAAIRALLNDSPEQVRYSREDAADCIRYMDTADVSPVRNGRWLPFHSTAAGDIQYCSACEIGCTWKPNYCPNCGAKMDLEG